LARQEGHDPADPLYERTVLETQHRLEDQIETDESQTGKRICLLHRGSLDALGFWLYAGGQAEEFFALTGTTYQAEYARYDLVVLMRSTANAAPDSYAHYLARKTRGSMVEALRLETCLERAWAGHPRFFILPNTGLDWPRKSQLARTIIESQTAAALPALTAVNKNLNQIPYPSTHQYTISPSGQIQPTEKAARRLDELQRVLPRHAWQSALDIGCGKGMFLLWVCEKFQLQRATGLDASAQMIQAARAAGNFIQSPAVFLHGTFDQLHPVLPPADLVLMLHCYHYIYFSQLASDLNWDWHAYWFGVLATLTRDTLVFANPLELTSKHRAEFSAQGHTQQAIDSFNRTAILAAAESFFTVEETQFGGGRPLIVMRTRRGQADG
jgi:SAM-dependent methyltransferase